ncbi:MAG: hypothetical protein AVDCRST_MAG10-3744, partial [uncultured Acidimicrobiales bacterium]
GRVGNRGVRQRRRRRLGVRAGGRLRPGPGPPSHVRHHGHRRLSRAPRRRERSGRRRRRGRLLRRQPQGSSGTDRRVDRRSPRHGQPRRRPARHRRARARDERGVGVAPPLGRGARRAGVGPGDREAAAPPGAGHRRRGGRRV